MSGGDGIVKIGISANPAAREKQLQTSNAHSVRLVRQWGPFNSPHAIEGKAHELLAYARMVGEWFSLNVDLACLTLDDLAASFIDSKNETSDERANRGRELTEYIRQVAGVKIMIDNESSIVKRALEMAERAHANANAHEQNFLDAIELSDYYQSMCKSQMKDLSLLLDKNASLAAELAKLQSALPFSPQVQ